MGSCASSIIKAIAVLSFLSRGHCLSIPAIATPARGVEISRKGNRWLPLHANNPERSLSASEQERREEEKRVRERAEDVVIGKTSAVSGASDYALDIAGTQEQWMRQASRIEQEIARLTDLGLEMMRMLRLEEASVAFDRVFALKPDAYLWQAGIVRYYLGDLDEAAEIFARCAATYETRFGEPASEERIWRNACLLRKISTLSRTDKKLVEQSDNLNALVAMVPESDNTPQLLQSERRRVLRLALDLFDSSIEKDIVKSIIARAKLRSTAGVGSVSPRMDKKLWKISSFYYLGLHADAMGDSKDGKICLKLALKLCPNANSVDLMHTLPLLHMTCRNWFDDEDFDTRSLTLPTEFFGLRVVVPHGVDPILIDSVRCSIEKMRLIDIQSALRSRGLKTGGSKEETQARLFVSLANDPTLTS